MVFTIPLRRHRGSSVRALLLDGWLWFWHRRRLLPVLRVRANFSQASAETVVVIVVVGRLQIDVVQNESHYWRPDFGQNLCAARNSSARGKSVPSNQNHS